MKIKISMKYPLTMVRSGFGTVIIVSNEDGLVDQVKRSVIESNNRRNFNPTDPQTFTGFHIQSRRGPTIFVVEADCRSLHAWTGKGSFLQVYHFLLFLFYSLQDFKQINSRVERKKLVQIFFRPSFGIEVLIHAVRC